MSSTKCTQVIKFLYSYGGKILPRHSDGMLRYIGGFTRVLSVDRSISVTDLMVKFGELCGSSMKLKCKLPSEDLDVLISITCDEDLMNVIQEYDRVSAVTNQDLKIRAVLFPINPTKKMSPPSSPMSCFDFPASKRRTEKVYSPPSYAAAQKVCSPPSYAAAQKVNSPPSYAAAQKGCSSVLGYPVDGRRCGGKFYYPCCERGSPRHLYFVSH